MGITNAYTLAVASGDAVTALGRFFTPEPVYLAQGYARFPLFSVGHLLMVAACFAFAMILLRHYQHLPSGMEAGSRRRRQLLAMAGTAVALLAIRDIVMTALGLMQPVFWPLHICNFCEYLALAYALHPHGKLGLCLGDLLFCWAFPGSIGALLFPGWTYCPLLSFASLGGFAEHALLLAFVLCMLSGGGYQPNWRRFWIPTVAALIGGCAFRLLNPLFGTNFFFVTDPAASGPPFVWAARTFGDPAYLAFYLLAAIGIWLVAYGIWQALNRNGHSSRGR